MAKSSSDPELHYDESSLDKLESMLKKPAGRRYKPRRQDRAVSASSHFWTPRTPPTPSPTKSPSPSRPALHRTAYLDGLRGFAALMVFNLHHEVWAHSSTLAETGYMENTYGAEGHHWFVGLPIIRTFFTGGHLAVAVFFIISGYCLSAKPLTLIYEGERGKLADNLTSALFRRWFRLNLPVLATTFIWMTSWHLTGVLSTVRGIDPPEKNWFAEVWKWYCDFKNFSFIFQNEPTNKYNSHAWSIALEFRGSIVVFTTLLALSRCSHKKRLMGEAALVWYFTYIVDAWYCGLFAMGILMCDLDLLGARKQVPHFVSRFRPSRDWIYYIILLVGMYLGGVQSLTDDLKYLRYKSPGWYYLSFLKPQAFWDHRWFFRFVGATCIMIAVNRLRWLKTFFETSFCQYLGKISYSLYLVHGPILVTLGSRFYAAAGRPQLNAPNTIPRWINWCRLPDYGIFGLEVNFLLPYFLLMGFSFWAAEMTTRLIDEPSVRFAAWLFKEAVDDHESEALPRYQALEVKEKA